MISASVCSSNINESSLVLKMVFNPYQSRLMRFAVGQYQRGVKRHRKALGRANSTVKLSAELGTALLVLPVYVAARASILAGRRLGNTVMGRSLSMLSERTNKLLSFSGFEKSSFEGSGWEESGWKRSVDELGSDFSVNGKTARAALLLPEPISQMIAAVGHCLSVSQLVEVAGLEEPDNGLSSPSAVDEVPNVLKLSENRLRRWARRYWVVAKRLLNFEEVSLTKCGGLTPAESRQITGVASDIETRSLLLVLDYEVAWNGLSLVQQQRLQQRIAMFESGSALARKKGLIPFAAVDRWLTAAKTLLRRIQGRRDSLQKRLPMPARSERSHWSQSLDLSTRSRSNVNCEVVQSDVSDISSSWLACSQKANAVSTAADVSNEIAGSGKVDRCDRIRDLSTIEADVISAIYIEHPLEKVLKWVDRTLLWLEKQWQWLKQSLMSQIEAMFHL